MKTKLSNYIIFTKFRLAALVIVSAALGYCIGENEFDASTFALLILGGFAITAASNGLNQIFERELDKLMSRTMQRPLPTAKMSMTEAVVAVLLFTISGTLFLWLGTNPLCTILSITSLFIYAFIYTPLKRVTPLSVFVGAIPGALPPMLGWVAAKGYIGYEALLLFGIQFIWQFPHFWAIAWRSYEDYKKAGFYLLPFASGHSKENAFQIVLYAFMLIPISALPWIFGFINPITGVLTIVCAILFCLPAIKLYNKCSMQAATRLMFASFIYLPVVQVLILINI